MQQNERVPREKIQTSYFLNHPNCRNCKCCSISVLDWSQFASSASPGWHRRWWWERGQ